MISRDDPANVQLLDESQPTSNGSRFFVGVSPDGSQIIYLGGGGKQLLERNISQAALETVGSLLFDITQWTYRGPVKLAPVCGLVWRPGSMQVFLYSDISWAGGYTFLLDVNSGQICELKSVEE